MSEKLILRLSSQTNSSVPWLVWSLTNKEVIASGELPSQAELDKLSEYSKGRKVTVLVDSADVRLYRHYMPTKPSRQILKALPYMLEDELAEDIEKLHFATGENGFDKEQESYWIDLAIVNKELVNNWLELLANAGIQCKTMIPEILCLPLIEGADHAAIQLGNNWLIRESAWQGSSLDSSWLEMYWQSALAKTEDVMKVAMLSPFSDAVQSLLIESNKVEFVSVEPEMAMMTLAKGAEDAGWNLLQGELAPKKSISPNWLIWRPVFVLTLIVLLVNFIGAFVSWQSNNSQLEQAKQELAASYKKAFPKEKFRANIVRRTLKRKVSEATGGGSGDANFLAYMQRLTPIFSKFSKTKVESIRFDGNRQELRLAITASSFQNFEQFKVAIEGLGLEVKQGAVNNEGNSVTGSLSIKERS